MSTALVTALTIGSIGCGESSKNDSGADPADEASSALRYLAANPSEYCDAISAQQLKESFGPPRNNSFGGTTAEALKRCRRMNATQRPAEIEILSARELEGDRVELDVAIEGKRGTQFTMWMTGGRWIVESIH